MNTIESEDRLGLTFCDRIPLVIEKGIGTKVWDEQHNEYLDFTSGWGVTCLGHSHPVITDALTEQAGKIMQSPNAGFTYSPARARLLQELSAVIPQSLEKLYFVNSGAEANDAAIKLARKISGKTKIISALSSFHGRTFNTLTVSTGRENGERYLPLSQHSCFVEFGDIQALEQQIDGATAAVILEPIQGEGGVRIPIDNYLHEVSSLCQRHGVFLIVDEIQTGFCRTGKFFAIEHSASPVKADFMTMGKGLAGGFPIAAFAVSAQVANAIEKGDHGGTYCGNPLGCAVAAAVVSYLRQSDVASAVTLKGKQFEVRLTKLARKFPDHIEEVRGQGLLWAIQLRDQSRVVALTEFALARGLLIVPTRNCVVRLIPSLLADQKELSRGLGLLEDALACLG